MFLWFQLGVLNTVSVAMDSGTGCTQQITNPKVIIFCFQYDNIASHSPPHAHTHTHTNINTHTHKHTCAHTHKHTHSIQKKESLQDKPASNNNISPKLWQSCRHAITKPSGPSCHKCHLALECVGRNHAALFDWKVLCSLFCWPATSCCRQASWTGMLWPL